MGLLQVEGSSSGAWKFVWGPPGPLRLTLGGRRGLGWAGQALGGRRLRGAATTEREESGPDRAGAEDEHDAVGASLEGVPDALAGRKEDA